MLLLKLRMFLLDCDVILVLLVMGGGWWNFGNGRAEVAAFAVDLLAEVGRLLDQVRDGLVAARLAHRLHEGLVGLRGVERVRARRNVRARVPLDRRQESVSRCGAAPRSSLQFVASATSRRIWNLLLHRHGHRGCDGSIDLQWNDRRSLYPTT